MIWLAPLAWIGAAAVALPVLIHVLVQRRAQALLFPTLRFLPHTRIAAIRRHRLDDWLLLLVRVAVILAATAALAGPLLLTGGRRAAWNGRVARAFVGTRDDIARAAPQAEPRAAVARRDFETADVRDGIARAAEWLGTVPPARRELVVAAPFAQESVDAATIAGIPRDIGVRLVRVATLPAKATVDGGLRARGGALYRRTIELDGPSTSVVDRDGGEQADFPVRVIADVSSKAAIDAAISAVRSVSIGVPAPGHRARLVIAGPRLDHAALVAEPVRVPWIADVLADVSNDSDLQTSAARVAGPGTDPDLSRQPWFALARGSDGRVLVAGASAAGEVLVASAAPAADVITPVLLRAISNALAPPQRLAAHEIMPIADDDLRAWERPPAPVVAPGLDTIVDDDRRWLWAATLGLLALEMLMRRNGRTADGETAIAREEDRARVA